jgi:uncharacterized protein
VPPLPPSLRLGGPDPRVGTPFGRYRRRLGVGLLALSALLTVWSLSQGPGPADARDACGPWAPADAAPIALPLASADALAPLLGAVVCVTHELTVTETFALGRRGELLLADRRLFADHTGLDTGDPALRAVLLSPPWWPDDAWPLAWGLDVGGIRVGDAATEVAGRLRRAEGGGYAVVAERAPRFLVRNPRPPSPPDVGGDLRVAAFNVFNYFVTLGARGARTEEELARQTDKLVAALARLDADVLALMEVEAGDAALAALARALNDALAAEGSPRRYEPAPTPAEGTGGDAIRQAFLVDAARVEVLAVAGDPAPVHERSPQALTLRDRAGGEPFTLVAVHHRSKASCPTAGDVDVGFGCWNLRRAAQSEALRAFAERVAREVGSDGVLLLGDFNAHRFEPPVTLFERPATAARAAGAPLTWEVLTDRVRATRRLTYVFRGQSAALDHAIASGALAARVTGVDVWAINADEPPVADYRMRFNPPGAFQPDPYRSSDHDPILVGIARASAVGIEEPLEDAVVEASRLTGLDVAAGGQVPPAATLGAGHLAAQEREVAARAGAGAQVAAERRVAAPGGR